MKKFALLMLAALLTACGTIKPAVDATDGKAFGIVPDSLLAPFAGKVNKQAESWLNQQADMAKLAAFIPVGTPLNYGIRLKGTKDAWINLADYEQVMWLDPVVTSLTLSAPDTGRRVTLRPVISPTVPAVPDSPPVGGGAVGDPLDAEVNSTLEVVK